MTPEMYPSSHPVLDDVKKLLNLPVSLAVDVADDGTLLTNTNIGGTSQLWEVRPDGARVQLTDFSSTATGRYLPGSRKLLISSDTDGNERHQLYLLDPESAVLPVSSLPALIDDPEHIYQLMALDAESLVYSTNRRNEVDFDLIRRRHFDGEEEILWAGGGNFAQVSASPDGRYLVSNAMSLQPASNTLRLLDVVAKQWQVITAEDIPGQYGEVSWLADSSGFFSSQDADTDFRSVSFYRIADSRWHSFLAEPEVNVTIRLNEAGNRALIQRLKDGQSTLSLSDLHTGDNLPELGPEVPVSLPEAGYAVAEISANGQQLAVTFSSPTFPDEVFSAALAEHLGEGPISLTQRTFAEGREIAKKLPSTELVRIPTRDGEQIPAFVTRGDASAVLNIHGGPEAASLYQWSPRNAALMLSGHTVVVPNVRGSSGYGRRWMSMDDVELRLDSVEDLVDIHRWLVGSGINAGRVALYGGSYGGYMVLAGMTFHPEYWAAGVDIVGMSSLVTFMENTSPYRRAYREREYGSVEQHRQVLQDASPLPRIQKLAKPLMVIHGANDPRVPLSEAEQVAAAVRANGSECEMLVYSDEGHGLSRRKNQLDAYPRAVEFLRRTLDAVLS
ncbi:dipeptidyl aminopeptidase/acylaminoacyl peptidase [Psychromicrobium silvestre]|uniref:Dipeptidyl aminopeptidase/acylaminoacyl peptidase n=1 Tax=Psychromicrobium silvestre TaxID=1645614 RepID=A0A7Y9S8L8_9MICC|nr:S9 family peptidase [Psychromicrobium silvestre]NYE95482.1 dipeptidyl aminopeptidase/acylaminoacyl peptidase [Psychromicrobium silvestre]